MASTGLILSNLGKIRHFCSFRRNLTLGKIIFNKPKASISESDSIPNVQGLSEACLKVPNDPVGPGAAKNSGYKNPEYFSYDKTSYFEAEIEMLKYRCPQPSSDKPYIPSSK
ncbi:hypothetical protein JTB14_007248 [Gonioctena quinquepunctata]|nr:hypothetical protein JTB14_007248 [Gonioctena quinquepunctata]